MIVDTFPITYQYGDTWTLKPIFDVHKGNIACDVRAYKKFLELEDERTLFIGGGDLLDAIVVPDKRYQKSVDDTKGNAIIDEQIETMYDLLMPYREKILGLGIGNHEEVIIRKCGTDPIHRLCEKLSTKNHQVKYLGYSCLIKLAFTDAKGGRGRPVIVRQHHGWGGGSRTAGADITKFERDMGKWDADIFLYGHVHKKQTQTIPRLGHQGKKLIARDQALGICGTFLKTYTEGADSTYPERAGYPPTAIGGIQVTMKPLGTGWMKIKAED